METLTDRELIQSCLSGSGRQFQPFETLVRRYESQVYRLCLKYFRNTEVAEDMTQEAFLKAYAQLKNLDNPDTFRSWLLRMTSNLCTDHYRKLRRRREIHDRIEQEMGEDLKTQNQDVEKGLENKDLIAAIEKLDEKEKTVIFLHYFSELSTKEVAQDLGIGESAVKMRMSRAREKLESLLKKM